LSIRTGSDRRTCDSNSSKEHLMPDDTTWSMIHTERTALAEVIGSLTPEQWATPSLCSGWTVGFLACHLLAAAEQTPAHFIGGVASTGFRFNAFMDKDAKVRSQLTPAQVAERLHARTTTTNKPPAPTQAMLGEVVIHGEDLRRPIGLHRDLPAPALLACLESATKANFPVGGKKRIAGLSLTATDCDWTWGSGPEVRGPGAGLLLAMTGRKAGLEGLTGPGFATFAGRVPD
jgi:uncharacterized protein (TIGR03083 family)